MLPLVCAGSLVALLQGCASYEPNPLDLTRHDARLAARLLEVAPIEAYLNTLGDGSSETPDRFDPADGLSLAEGEVAALFYNPDLRISRLDAGVARATHETAGLWEDPRFGFDGAEILSPAGPFEFGATLSLTIPVSGRLAVEKARAGAAFEAGLRRIVDAEWNTRAQVRARWAAWTVARERRALADEMIEQVGRIGEITDRLEASGELTRVEARLIRAARVEARADRANAEYEAEAARLTLLGLMGLDPLSTVGLVARLPTSERSVVGENAARLIESSTLLAVRRAEYRVAEETLRLEVRKQYPDITIGTGLGSEGGDDRLLLGVSLPIPVLNANRAGIAEAGARRDAARAAAETTYERLKRELAIARARADAAASQREAYERELVPMLDEQAGEIERLIGLGDVNTLLLLETVTRRFDAKSRLLDLRLAEIEAAIEIERLLGPTVGGTPEPPAIERDDHNRTAATAEGRSGTSEEATR